MADQTLEWEVVLRESNMQILLAKTDSYNTDNLRILCLLHNGQSVSVQELSVHYNALGQSLAESVIRIELCVHRIQCKYRMDV